MGGAEPEARTSRETDRRRTIAVLPFVNMSGDEENEYFSDGVAEEILNLLTRLPQLRVSSRSSSFAYKGEQINVKKVSEDLGVSTLLEGSVRRADEAQSEFENAIKLNPKLFEARYFYARDCYAQGNFEQAAELFADASAVNPSDYQSPTFQAMALKELGRKEEAAAASTHAYKAAEKHLELHPDDARALYLGAGALVELDEFEKARAWADRALDTDRDEPAVLYNVACVYSLIGEKDQAIGLLDEAIQNGFGYRAWLENDNNLANLRDDPRFAELLKRLD